jgi:hypothetical protein
MGLNASDRQILLRIERGLAEHSWPQEPPADRPARRGFATAFRFRVWLLLAAWFVGAAWAVAAVFDTSPMPTLMLTVLVLSPVLLCAVFLDDGWMCGRQRDP